ncbi:hypothetical protein P175DRAFT_0504385 [Aspergillus ochraceoroseus IBT 24754]|uniref:Uncharacterized protein n=1 Tax=Aspergillus ochraceoroseus IBT 24754 TaxID=1392256 RepID=A0A2T5LMY5_9EURO|nr:uncharacterized protein P175DRAFT_0504385 [Aspergillus ochraceoroseus IBT 24754]PTU17645.1 hypothetical protein P175DRAFT_0504385 [Aspergillus ochraceoroseus IBT 24754]
MASHQKKQKESRQRQLPQPSTRTDQSLEPDRRTHRATSIESTGSVESGISHYLHYQDNSCFFAPEWLEETPARGDQDQEHALQ